MHPESAPPAAPERGPGPLPPSGQPGAGGDARQERHVPGGHLIAGPGQGTRRPLRDKREPKRGVRFSIAIAHWLCNVV